jgi:UDP-N-acetylmuramoyl-tripeptide--D-alanyl-D-alanine ligase
MGARAEHLSAELFDKEIRDFSIDSRSVGAGELFFALSQADYARAGFNGTFADGHQFIAEALKGGAIAAVARADQVVESEYLQRFNSRLLLVDDAIAALQELARRVYAAWNRPVVGITGSAGKTTAKELTAHVMSNCGWRVLEEPAQLQQQSGPHPWRFCRWSAREGQRTTLGVAVLEMGSLLRRLAKSGAFAESLLGC